MFETPILFIIFNRPETTRKVFNELCKLKPRNLYIAADGPRSDKPEDIDKCKNTRLVVQNIDWECNVQTLFRDNNLGCGKGVSEAISWFFGNVEEGIILEDDCIPHADFFLFCSELLSRYKSDTSVLSIAGSNFQDGKKRGDASYYFSVHNRIWGWATWRRTWENYDFLLKNIEENEFAALVNRLFRRKAEQEYWMKVFEMTKGGKIDTWDFQFMFSQWKLSGLTITPNANLVSNIGYDNDATHTAWGENNPNLNRQVYSIYPLSHPEKLDRDLKADEYYFTKYIKPPNRLWEKIDRNMKKILKFK